MQEYHHNLHVLSRPTSRSGSFNFDSPSSHFGRLSLSLPSSFEHDRRQAEEDSHKKWLSHLQEPKEEMRRTTSEMCTMFEIGFELSMGRQGEERDREEREEGKEKEGEGTEEAE